MLESGIKIKWRAMDSSLSKIIVILENSKMTTSMGMESLSGKIEWFMKDSGKMASNMA